MSRKDDRYTQNGWDGYDGRYPDQGEDGRYQQGTDSGTGQYDQGYTEQDPYDGWSDGGTYPENGGYQQGGQGQYGTYDGTAGDMGYTDTAQGGYQDGQQYGGVNYYNGTQNGRQDTYGSGYQGSGAAGNTYSSDSGSYGSGDNAYDPDGYGYDEGYQDDGYDDGSYAGGQDGYSQGQGYDDGYSGGYDGTDGYDNGYDGDYPDEDERGGRSRSRKGSASHQGGGGHKKKNTKRIVLLAVEIAALIVVIAILYMVTRVERVGKVDLSETDIQENISEEVKQDEETGAMKGYRQIVFFGVDSTEGQLDQKTRSDSIIIASINQDTDEVKLISVYRDTLLNLSNDEYNKCNAAYAQGGPEQAINMLNMNLDLNISDFVTIGFGGLTDVINALGGVEIDVDEDEISHLNNYQSTMAKELGISYTEVTSAGLQTLDGLQATAYCRIRYTYGWDYKRAARQREVLYQIIQKAQSASVTQLAQIATDAFSEIYTSYDLNNLVSDVSSIANYTVIQEEDTDQMQNGFPQEQYRIQANLSNALGDCVVPRTLVQNVVWLHQFLFDDTDYQVSDQVQAISDHIDEMTADAVPEELTDADHT